MVLSGRGSGFSRLTHVLGYTLESGVNYSGNVPQHIPSLLINLLHFAPVALYFTLVYEMLIKVNLPLFV